jgi:hypothetical protein
MHRPVRPRRRALGAAVACCTLLAVPTLAPAAASADFAAANTWTGGTLGGQPAGGPKGLLPRSGAVVSIVTGSSRARMNVAVFDGRCSVGMEIPRGTSTVAPGGPEFFDNASVHAARTLRYRDAYGTSRMRMTVDLTPASPGVMQGTVRLKGRAAETRRGFACDVTSRVVVRSSQSLFAPLAPATTAAVALRTGIVQQGLSPRVPAAIAMVGRPDGRVHVTWSYRRRCVSAGKRYWSQGYLSIRRFAVRADGSFGTTVRGSNRNRYRGDRYVSRYTSTISGRIGSDGIARGRVSTRTSLKFDGGKRYGERCNSGSRKFVAAP